jgi:hypothetical protein
MLARIEGSGYGVGEPKKIQNEVRNFGRTATPMRGELAGLPAASCVGSPYPPIADITNV